MKVKTLEDATIVLKKFSLELQEVIDDKFLAKLTTDDLKVVLKQLKNKDFVITLSKFVEEELEVREEGDDDD